MEGVEEIDRYLEAVNIARMEIDRVDQRPNDQGEAIPPAPIVPINGVAVNNIDREPQVGAGANMINNQNMVHPRRVQGAHLPARQEPQVEIANQHVPARDPVMNRAAAPGGAQLAQGGAEVAPGGGGPQGGAARLQQVGAAIDVQAVQQIPGIHQNNDQEIGAAANDADGVAANGRFHPYRGNRAGHRVRIQQMSQNILRVIGDIGFIAYGQRRKGKGGRGGNRGGNGGNNVGGNHGHRRGDNAGGNVVG